MDFSWIDIVIVAIFLLFAVKGLAEGFVKSFLSFALVIIALIVAKIFSPNLALYFTENSKWVENLHQTIQAKVISLFGGSISSGSWTESTQLHNTPVGLQNFLDTFISDANKTIGNLTDAFTQNLTGMIVNIISFLAIFIAVMFVGSILIAILNRIAELPILKVFNRAGGLLIGIVKGVIVICLFSTLIYYSNLLFGAVELSTAINNSFLIKYFYIGFLFT